MGYRKAWILILEDETDWQEILTRSLQWCEKNYAEESEPIEFEIHVAKTLEEAKILVSRHTFHVWLLDISLEKGNDDNREGIEFLQEFVQLGLTRHVAIFMISAHANSKNFRDSLTDDNKALDFLPKSEFDREEFCNRVRRVFVDNPEHDRVRINLHLEIIYEDPYRSALDVVSNMKVNNIRLKPPKDDESAELTDLRVRAVDEFEDLLCQLFYRAKQVTISASDDDAKGHSGAGVVVARTRDDLGPGSFLIIKFGEVPNINIEYKNYYDNVENRLSRVTDLRSNPTRTTHLGGLLYGFLGYRGQQLRSLTTYYKNATSSALIDLVNDIFQNLCRNWYIQSDYMTVDLTKEYIELTGFTQDLLLEGVNTRLRKTVKHHDDDQIEFTNLSRPLLVPNPVTFMRDRHETMMVYTTINHGDFNSDNILVDDNQKAWLIDFRNTIKGHSMRDLAKLDTVIRYQLLDTNDATLDERLLLEQTLNTPIRYEDINDLPEILASDNKDVQKAYAMCRRLRQLALGQFYNNQDASMRDYYTALMYFSLNFTRYFNRPSIQREHALLSAALLTHKLNNHKSRV